jgi:hypothetical protein
MAVVVVDDEEWQESHSGLTISLQMRGTSRAKVDILQTDTYIKVVHVYTVKKDEIFRGCCSVSSF